LGQKVDIFSNISTFWHSATCNSTLERNPFLKCFWNDLGVGLGSRKDRPPIIAFARHATAIKRQRAKRTIAPYSVVHFQQRLIYVCMYEIISFIKKKFTGLPWYLLPRFIVRAAPTT
jgi:hypothetical protein